jgi:CRP/FNR family transcriptional regulator
MTDLKDLRAISCFENLSAEEFDVLSHISTKRLYSKGEVLFYEKDKPKSLVILIDGIVKVYKTDQKNNEITMHNFFPKAIIAEMPLFEDAPYPASAIFMSDGAVIEVNWNEFKKRFLSNPDTALSFFKSLTQKIKYLEKVIDLNIVLDSTARVAKYLCEKDEALILKNNQLAQFLHMTPETLSRILKKFVKLNFIKKENGKYKILNKKALMVIFE